MVETKEDRQVAFEERAAILEYDEGLPRAEAERLALEPRIRRNPSSSGQSDWRSFVPAAGPGVTITPMPIEVSPAEYDAHLDSLIAAAEPGSIEANVLAMKKRQGRVIARGGDLIYVRGR